MSKPRIHTGWLVFQIAPDTASGLRWCYQDAHQHIFTGETAEGLPCPQQFQALLLLPAEDATLHRQTMAGRKLDALKWQLEPLLLEDVESLHILPVEREGDQHLLAVIARERLSAHCDAVRAQGFEVKRAVPELLLLQPATLMHQRDKRVIRLEDGSGLTLSEAEWILLHGDFPALAALDVEPDCSLSQLAPRAISCRFNALPAAPSARVSTRALPLVCLSALLLLLAGVMDPLWQGVQNQRQLTALNQQVLARYQHYFPQETPARPRQQFSRKLNQLEVTREDSGLLALLGQHDKALNQLGQNPLKKLNWDASTQRLRLTFSRPLTGSVPKQDSVQINENIMTLGKQ